MAMLAVAATVDDIADIPHTSEFGTGDVRITGQTFPAVSRKTAAAGDLPSAALLLSVFKNSARKFAETYRIGLLL